MSFASSSASRALLPSCDRFVTWRGLLVVRWSCVGRLLVVFWSPPPPHPPPERNRTERNGTGTTSISAKPTTMDHPNLVCLASLAAFLRPIRNLARLDVCWPFVGRFLVPSPPASLPRTEQNRTERNGETPSPLRNIPPANSRTAFTPPTDEEARRLDYPRGAEKKKVMGGVIILVLGVSGSFWGKLPRSSPSSRNTERNKYNESDHNLYVS